MSDNIEAVRAKFDQAEDIAPVDGLSSPDGKDIDGPSYDDGSPADPRAQDLDIPEFKGAKLPLNDTGNGLRFALYCGGDAMFVPRVGWHIWDSKRWKLDPDGINVRRHAQTIHEWIEKEVPHISLNSSEKASLERLETVQGYLKNFEEKFADLKQVERTAKKQELISEREKLSSILWGRGSSRQRHKTFAKSSGNTGAIKNMLIEATTSLGREVDDLNKDPLTINVSNGLLRFTKSVDPLHDSFKEDGSPSKFVASYELLPHEREVLVPGKNSPQYITKLMPVDYDCDAKCPKFDAFLEMVQPDPQMRKFLQRWFGLSITGLQVQKYLYCYGMGANGKSLLAGLMRRMMGDYATMVKIESLIGINKKSGSDATPDLFRLIGARAAITSEPPEGERLQEGKMKEMTGGEEMLVRTLHSDFVEFTPYFKLTFTGNHKLEIRGTDDGIWRRTLLCPFDVQIPEAERDETLGDQIFDEERSGILNWMIAGLIDYLEGGLQEPLTVLEATEEYRKDSDPIGDFLNTACAIDGDNSFISARDLVDGCYLYLLENTSHSWQPGNLQRKLKDRAQKHKHPKSGKFYSRHKKNGTWGYTGIQLSDEMRRHLDAAPRDQKGLPQLSKDNVQQDDPTPYTSEDFPL